MTLQDQPPAASSRGNTRRNQIVGAAIALAALVVIIAVNHASSGPAAGTLVLRANGGSAMDVTYSAGDKNSQDTSAASPWQVSYKVTGDMPVVSLVVQNRGSGSDTVTCSITEDGQVVSSNTSHGAYAVAQCSH